MRISDWSSDVCSSDLYGHSGRISGQWRGRIGWRAWARCGVGLRQSARGHNRLAAAHGLSDWPRRTQECCNGSSALSRVRSEEHTSELQSLMRISYAVFCLKKKIMNTTTLSQNLKNQAQR